MISFCFMAVIKGISERENFLLGVDAAGTRLEI
jgi:hypothetical protein